MIVIAIIAILALIAIPNFLEAQIRSKLSRARADMRSIATAITAYTVDNNRAPIGFAEGDGAPLNLWTKATYDWAYNALTTPIAYMTSVPNDPFVDRQTYLDGSGNPKTHQKFEYQCYEWDLACLRKGAPFPTGYSAPRAKCAYNGYPWYIRTPGPGRQALPGTTLWDIVGPSKDVNHLYDPSNGTMSLGMVYRTPRGEITGTGL